MKNSNLTLNKKVSLLLLSSLLLTIVFSFLFIHFLYKDLYIGTVKESLLYQGQRTADHYHYGDVSGSVKDKILWYNVISPYEVAVVEDLDDLTIRFPYLIDQKSLITNEDKRELAKGNRIMKEGYVEEFNRNVIGAIFPLMNEEKLMGYLLIYIPLAEMTEVFSRGIPILVLTGVMFYFVLFLVIQSSLGSLFKPIREMQLFSNKVAKGDFSGRLHVHSKDEMAELALTFNSMVESLQHQEERKRQFLANVAHELRTPLTYIGGYAKALTDRVQTNPEEMEESLHLIQKESIRMQRLITELLELNKLEDSSFSLDIEPIVLSQLIMDTLTLIFSQAKMKKIEINHQLNEESIINGDPDRVMQVFYNVLDNALKYSTEKSPIFIQSYEEDGMAVVKIQDSGIGIPEESLSQIGERFYRSDLSRTRNTGGYGLGLSIAKEIMHKHGGSFSIQSSEGKGTTVYLLFPLLDI
ncbi:HAMP domain-containing histidine kinase (plasmid) [Cytobacillus spongiae]|uniref:sensor histidine kinase n=1 Tax=Cytobacillus spongiae TaxID=2901381 RepID=UPI00145D4347|nr:HAMP domain-containing sensor histidine kinase [Cytobacillus spongiae]MCA1062857.1 HAMP domain-containing histidine kinase [Rossellomorea aquimaris]NMH70190.1 HAMP domain-containing protein [Bacillus sp. RO3]UII58466.1 HAMP domain-containing histidine kinase [Cytobacillus spongiae]WJV28507.1 ATP-binding protein [Rossellomorea sp. AcN35-11]